jgi:glycosyl transferase, family 25
MQSHDENGVFPPIYVLTCSLSPPQRLMSARQQIKALFPEHTLSVVMGYIGSDAKIDEIVDHFRMSIFTKWKLTRGEIATYATHRLAWEKFLASKAEYALILEDDFQFLSPEAVAGCFAGAGRFFALDCDIVKLFDFPRDLKKTTGVVRSFAEIELVKWQRPCAGMVAYIVSRKGAEKLLSRNAIFRVIDEDTKYYWELGLDIWSSKVNIVTDASLNLGGSLLERERSNSRSRTFFRSLHGFVLKAIRSNRNRIEFYKYCRSKNLKPVKIEV